MPLRFFVKSGLKITKYFDNFVDFDSQFDEFWQFLIAEISQKLKIRTSEIAKKVGFDLL